MIYNKLKVGQLKCNVILRRAQLVHHCEDVDNTDLHLALHRDARRMGCISYHTLLLEVKKSVR